MVEEVAREFTSHGKRACVMSYRGPAMHANGFDAVGAVGYLNFLIGNHDWKGGHIAASAEFAPFHRPLRPANRAGRARGLGHSHHASEDRVREDQLLQAGRLSRAASVYPLPGNLARDRAHP
ncbi:MAG: molybdopterin dinucleotide-binding protein, partial [Gordonibacter pamelaeae]